MAENAFDKGIDYLREAYQAMKDVEEIKASQNKAKAEAKRFSKLVAQEEKNKKDEITTAIKQRTDQIGMAYDNEMDVVRQKIKKLDAKRQTQKAKQQDMRYDAETEGFRQEASLCEAEIKNMLKQHHISAICRTDLFYSLFMPKGIKDFLVILLWLLVLLLVIPFCICLLGKYTFLKGVASLTVYYILIFVCCISIVFITYLLISNRTKVRYPEPLLHCRDEKTKLHAIKRQMRAVRNKIQKDKDESRYDLGSFDTRMEALKVELSEIGEQKKQALLEFDKTKRPVVEQEIAASHDGKIAEYEQGRKEAEDYQDSAESQLATLRLRIVNEYEAYLGKEYMTIEKLDLLLAIMEEEGVATIGEAIAVYNGKMEV